MLASNSSTVSEFFPCCDLPHWNLLLEETTRPPGLSVQSTSAGLLHIPEMLSYTNYMNCKGLFTACVSLLDHTFLVRRDPGLFISVTPAEYMV